MAKTEYLEILKRGVQAWNQWRIENQELEPCSLTDAVHGAGDVKRMFESFQEYRKKFLDLSEANLSQARLSQVNLSMTNLIGSKLRNADLREAKLEYADLRHADLFEADLSNAHLRGAQLNESELMGAVLHGVDLREADLGGAYLILGADLSGADLRGARLNGSYLRGADLSKAILIGADLSDADLRGANLTGTDLRATDLSGANLSDARLVRANLTEAILIGAVMVRTDLAGAELVNTSVFGVSAWDIELTGTKQSGLVITPPSQPKVTVDDLEVAQFIYLLLDNINVRKAIDSVTSKAVLILGRFTEERKAILEAIRNELRDRHYVPIIFDFDKPSSKDLTGTVETLARMARFIIADLTDPSSIPHELATVVPFLRTTPIQPLRLAGTGGYSMFDDLKVYPWVLDTYPYDSCESLLARISDVIGPVENMVIQLRDRD